MAKVRTVSVTYGRKQNLGDYNSVHSEITVWVDLDEDDNEAKVASATREMARNHVMSELARLNQKLQAKVQDVYLGLPVDVREDIDFQNGDD